jgi:DUF1009 family protein
MKCANVLLGAGFVDETAACSSNRRDSMEARTSIGLIAGGGGFPFEVARSAKRRGMHVVCAGIRGEVDPELAAEVDAFQVFGLGRVAAALRYFRRYGVRELSWAGWIRKERLFLPWRLWRHIPDFRVLRFWFGRLRRLDLQTQTILSAVAEEFEKEGFEIAHSAHYCPELLVEEGVFTRQKPNRRQLDDIAFGWNVAKRMADLDVGQSVAVHDRATLAVECIEGTDRNILRAGEYCRQGFTVVKLARTGHDMRFDVPTVGPRTIEAMRTAGARVLALEAGKTLFLEREQALDFANRFGIIILALRECPELSGPCPTLDRFDSFEIPPITRSDPTPGADIPSPPRGAAVDRDTGLKNH